jgi:hypothetical protein
LLLSESDIPLYDPLTFHQQLTAEGKSRVNACANSAPTDIRRWSWRMAVRAGALLRLLLISLDLVHTASR